VSNAHQVIEVLPRTTIQEVSDKIETAFPSLVAAFIDVLAEVRVLGLSVSLDESVMGILVGK
jgi:hypothetical protein